MPEEQDKDVIIAHLRAEIARKDQQIELLTQKVDALVKRIFGSSSEKLDLDQLLLFEAPKKPEGDGLEPTLLSSGATLSYASRHSPPAQNHEQMDECLGR